MQVVEHLKEVDTFEPQLPVLPYMSMAEGVSFGNKISEFNKLEGRYGKQTNLYNATHTCISEIKLLNLQSVYLLSS